VLAPPLVLGMAHLQFTGTMAYDSLAFLAACLVAGAVGEELLFRGYAFQLLLARVGPYATVLPMGVIFGLLHSGNPNASWLGLANTAGFGILFGYAYVRSRDLWLPIGLHFGWNVTLPMFGANLSGIKIINEVTGHRMVWTAGDLWSGGEYGPEASVLTTGVLLVLFVYLWKAPIRRQVSPLTDPPKEPACEPSQPLQP
jgi:membrane protease YdiL (CAAX protease family)